MRHLHANDVGPASLCGAPFVPGGQAQAARDTGELDCWLCATIAGIDLEEVANDVRM